MEPTSLALLTDLYHLTMACGYHKAGMAAQGGGVSPVAFPANAAAEELLVPIFRAGKRVYDCPPLAESRQRTAAQLAALHPGHKRLLILTPTPSDWRRACMSCASG